MVNRRGFLQGLLAAVAAVAIETKMHVASPALAVPEKRMAFDLSNNRYSYGINLENPLEVEIYDRRYDAHITPADLVARARDELSESAVGNAAWDGDPAFGTLCSISMSQGKLLCFGDEYQLYANVDELLVELPGDELHDSEVGALRILTMPEV